MRQVIYHLANDQKKLEIVGSQDQIEQHMKFEQDILKEEHTI